MMESIYEKFKKEFADFLAGLEDEFNKIWKDTLEDLTVKKTTLENKIAELQRNSQGLAMEIKKFSAELIDLNEKSKVAQANLTMLDDKRLALAEEVLRAEDVIKESRLKLDELNKKDEQLQDKEIELGAKAANLKEREIRIKKIFNKIDG